MCRGGTHAATGSKIIRVVHSEGVTGNCMEMEEREARRLGESEKVQGEEWSCTQEC